jgi:hypothetical protein
MSIRYHLVEPGMLLWQKARRPMGNVRATVEAWFPVRIIEKHDTCCLVSWNGNTPRTMRQKDVEKLYREQTQRKAP